MRKIKRENPGAEGCLSPGQRGMKGKWQSFAIYSKYSRLRRTISHASTGRATTAAERFSKGKNSFRQQIKVPQLFSPANNIFAKNVFLFSRKTTATYAITAAEARPLPLRSATSAPASSGLSIWREALFTTLLPSINSFATQNIPAKNIS